MANNNDENESRNDVKRPRRRYSAERNHQGIGNRLIGPALAAPANDDVGGGGVVRRRERPGGLLSFYHRGAA